MTRSGLGAAIVALITVVTGWWWNYEELVVFGVVLAAIVALAIGITRFGERPDIQRHLVSPRVARGEPIRLRYDAANERWGRTARFDIVDRCDDEAVRLTVAPIARGEHRVVRGEIATRRRGVYPVGPCHTERTDLFGLAVGRRDTGIQGSVIVHPRVVPLDGPYGALHSTDDDANVRTATADPLNGFVSLREYIDGDDPRLIHWPTSARMGTLMLRETVELRRPEFTIVVDTAESSSNADDFEEVVDVAASLAVDALAKGIDVRMRTTDRDRLGPSRGIQQESLILDFLTTTERTPDTHTASIAELFQRGGSQGRVVIVTGASGPSSNLVDTSAATVVRIGADAASGGGVHLAAADAIEFSRTWRP